MIPLVFWGFAWIFASFPWFNDKIFGVYGNYFTTIFFRFNLKKKPLWLTMLESYLFYLVVIMFGFFLENLRGVRFNQSWQFWVIIVCIWTVLIFPVAVWFKLRKK